MISCYSFLWCGVYYVVCLLGDRFLSFWHSIVSLFSMYAFDYPFIIFCLSFQYCNKLTCSKIGFVNHELCFSNQFTSSYRFWNMWIYNRIVYEKITIDHVMLILVFVWRKQRVRNIQFLSVFLYSWTSLFRMFGKLLFSDLSSFYNFLKVRFSYF